MWDNPRLLNLAADALYVAAALLAAAIAWHAAITSALPVRTVTLSGDLAHVNAEAVQGRLEGQVSGNFLVLDLDDVRGRLADLPWVRNVEVRRQWPAGLAVRLEEHVPLGRWSDGRLLSVRGEVFAGTTDLALPLLAGPPGTGPEVAKRYEVVRELVSALGLQPTAVTLSERYAWRVKLSNGVELDLGRDQARHPVEERLARFVAAYPRTVATLNRRLEHVDLRYPNGFAVRLTDLPPLDAGAAPARRRG